MFTSSHGTDRGCLRVPPILIHASSSDSCESNHSTPGFAPGSHEALRIGGVSQAENCRDEMFGFRGGIRQSLRWVRDDIRIAEIERHSRRHNRPYSAQVHKIQNFIAIGKGSTYTAVIGVPTDRRKG